MNVGQLCQNSHRTGPSNLLSLFLLACSANRYWPVNDWSSRFVMLPRKRPLETCIDHVEIERSLQRKLYHATGETSRIVVWFEHYRISGRPLIIGILTEWNSRLLEHFVIFLEKFYGPTTDFRTFQWSFVKWHFVKFYWKFLRDISFCRNIYMFVSLEVSCLTCFWFLNAKTDGIVNVSNWWLFREIL